MRTRWIIVVAAVALVLGACGGGGDDTQTGASEGDAGPAAVGKLDKVKTATIRIVATGSFVDPAEGLQLNAAGSGSGFIIDPSGIAVTNNHVVTGAATLDVYVNGEDRPRNAKVLGVSQCSDLAVIDINGDDFPYLEWFSGEITTGLTVYAAGYPLGDPEFTLTRGIVSKEHANGETSWASVDNVIEHDSRINPGNSGGPLVSDTGQVVGINYAGSDEDSQYFAVSEAEASSVIDDLRAGTDVNSVGINGEAFYDDTLGGGIWVYSVSSGSPADKVGIQGGDVVTRFEGLAIAEDGTLAQFCDVLRSHDPSDELGIEIYRYDTQQRFEGEINGDALTEVFDLSGELGDDLQDSGETQGVTGTYDYTTLTDDTGTIQVDVPTVWTDIDGSVGERGPSIEASTNLEDYQNGWTSPGVSIGATSEYGPDDQETLLDQFAQESCTLSDGRQAYDDNVYTGYYDYFTDCGGTTTALVNIAASPADGSFLVFVTVQMVDDADLKALDQIIATFQVVGDLAAATG